MFIFFSYLLKMKRTITLLGLLILGEINFISPSSADIIIEKGATVNQIEDYRILPSNPENLADNISKLIIKEGANIGTIKCVEALTNETKVCSTLLFWEVFYGGDYWRFLPWQPNENQSVNFEKFFD